MLPVLLSTRNLHKLEEFREILGPNIPISGLDTIPDFGEVEETGDTFASNAFLKAVAASRHFQGLVLADDSGLEVDALGGQPGVRSARYAGETSAQSKNNQLLLKNLSNIPDVQRTARFHCSLAIARCGEPLECFHGTVEGVITHQLQGEEGFGYDPLFIPEGFSKTFAQLGPGVKNTLSHRARAIQTAKPWIERYLAANPL